MERRGNQTKIAVVQMEPRVGDKEQNVAETLELIEEAARKKAKIIVLPELCSSGYVFSSSDEVRKTAENIPEGPTVKLWIQKAQEYQVYIIAGMPEREGALFRNSAVIVGPEGYIGKYQKKHLFFEEKLWFKPGNTEIPVFETILGRLGVMICFDLSFPEIARILAIKGADLICHPTNWVRDINPTLVVARAAENRVFIAASDRIGTERGLSFVGSSMIVDPRGEILVQGSRDREEVLITQVNLSEARWLKTINEMNNMLTDRRIDIYDTMLGYRETQSGS